MGKIDAIHFTFNLYTKYTKSKSTVSAKMLGNTKQRISTTYMHFIVLSNGFFSLNTEECNRQTILHFSMPVNKNV